MSEVELGNKSTANDVDGLKQRIADLEVALRDRVQHYRVVADFTYDWEYWITAPGKFEYISPSCERITGYSATAFVEDPALLERIIHPDDRGFMGLHLHEDVTSHDTVPLAVDFRIVHRNGDIRWIGHVCQSVFGERGKWLGRRCSNRDVTVSKKADEERKRLVVELRDALAKVKALSGFLPICSSCKKIRDDQGYWHQIECYIRDHSSAEFSHSICPACARKLYPQLCSDEPQTHRRSKVHT